jgi:DNA-binding transcriptional LysR family regulator
VNLQQLRYFVVLAEELHFQRAALRIPCAQSSLSEQVARLERHVGEPLLVRHPRHCELTAAGSRMYLEALRLLEAADRVLDVARGDVTRVRNRLRIGVPEEGLQALTPVLLASYRASHPGVEVSIESCDWTAMEDLATSSDSVFDAVLWGIDTPLDGLDGFDVYREPLVLVVGNRSDLADAPELAPEAVLDVPMIDIGEFMQVAASTHFLSDFRNGARPLLSGCAYADMADALSAIERSEGVVAVSPGTEIGGFDICSVPFDDPLLQVGVGVLIRSDERRPHVRDLATIGTEIGQELYELVPGALSPGPPSAAAAGSR